MWAAVGDAGRQSELRGGFASNANLREVSDYVLMKVLWCNISQGSISLSIYHLIHQTVPFYANRGTAILNNGLHNYAPPSQGGGARAAYFPLPGAKTSFGEESQNHT